MKLLAKVAADLGVYPLAAYDFVQDGLYYTVRKTYGQTIEPGAEHHVTGQQ